MLKRTLLFSNPYHLSAKNKQLVISDKGKNEKRTVPIEDIGYIVLEHPQITFTQSVIQLLAENNAAVIFCNNRYMPVSMLLHLDNNQTQSQIFREQIEASAALKNNLWRQTVKAKIENQAALLYLFDLPFKDLLNLAKTVKSGDKTNAEAAAARLYWRRLFGDSFRRWREGPPPNAFLNYGYAILRAATARALTGSGLLPTLGIFHRNKYNAYCLADDIMEPYRPFVDRLVVEITALTRETELSGEIKQHLLTLLTEDVLFDKNKRPLMLGLSQTSASLARCFKGEIRKISYARLQ